ncbi:MAG: hypothetical protein ACXAAK_09285, partial [Candidatus Thorarchaeota archaeon]
MSPVVADNDENRPAQNTIAMNIVPIVSDFLNITTVLDISREPTIRDGARKLERILDLILAVG